MTDAVLERVAVCQRRPLDDIYPIVCFNVPMVKICQNKQVINKTIYITPGVDL